MKNMLFAFLFLGLAVHAQVPPIFGEPPADTLFDFSIGHLFIGPITPTLMNENNNSPNPLINPNLPPHFILAAGDSGGMADTNKVSPFNFFINPPPEQHRNEHAVRLSGFLKFDGGPSYYRLVPYAIVFPDSVALQSDGAGTGLRLELKKTTLPPAHLLGFQFGFFYRGEWFESPVEETTWSDTSVWRAMSIGNFRNSQGQFPPRGWIKVKELYFGLTHIGLSTRYVRFILDNVVDGLSGNLLAGSGDPPLPLVAIDPPVSGSPEEFKLFQNYPNPFNPATTISYQLPRASDVELVIFNLLGQQVATLVNSRQNAGEHAVIFRAENLPSGVYVYRLTVGGIAQTRKMVLMK